jgi:hypothetical protein
MAWPIPDCGLFGATTTTSPISLITSISVLIPKEVIPSSLETNINGLFMQFLGFEVSGVRLTLKF